MYIIYKIVGAFNYYYQYHKGVGCWNGLKDNALKFKEERLAHSYKMVYRIHDGEVKSI